jgi:hypothetical protein
VISRIVGTFLKKNTKNKLWWSKLAIAIVVSNIFFFVLFTSTDPIASPAGQREGLVEVQLRAEIMTPFQHGKKVILLNRKSKLRVEGVLKEDINAEEKFTIWVREERASVLFDYNDWEILPYLKNLAFPIMNRGKIYEIRY